MDHPILCPICSQPATQGLAENDFAWHCANEACSEFGQFIADEETSTDQPQ